METTDQTSTSNSTAEALMDAMYPTMSTEGASKVETADQGEKPVKTDTEACLVKANQPLQRHTKI